jgi:hypothetical protein
MPSPDPLPHPREPSAASMARRERAWRRYKQLMSWMAIAAVVAVLLALLYLKRSGGPVPPAMIGATIAGVGLSVLLGTGLMGLVFLSHTSGIDEEAGGEDPDDH